MRLLLLAILCVPAVAAQAPIRVMSFNIRYVNSGDGAHIWPNRREPVIATLRDHSPHLIGLQEALRSQLDDIGAAFHRYRQLGVGREDGIAKGEYAALLVDTTRFTVVSTGTFWFSDTPEVPNSMHWGNRVTRISTWARLVDRLVGDTIRVYNVHWDHESQPSREKSAALLLTRMAADKGANDRLLVLGDFNSDETNPAYKSMVTSSTIPLKDTFRVRSPNATVVGTFNSFKGDSTGGKIDFVLTGPGWSVQGAGIDRRRIGAIWPSDHFPVWAIIER